MMKHLLLTGGAGSLKALMLATAMFAAPATASAQQFDLTILESKANERQTIRRLAATQDQLRLEGEYSELRLAVFAPRDEVLLYRKLQVDYLTAVSSMPEFSSLSVLVNGQQIGALQLQAGQQGSLQNFDLPPGLMVEGFNEVRFIARHKHRVDCSIDATYELWTVLNAANTGIVFDPGGDTAPKVVTDLDILRAVTNDPSGATNMRLLQLGNLSAGNLDRALTVAQAIATFGKYSNPDIQIRPEPGTGAGLDIIVGTQAELSKAGYAIGQKRTDIPGLAIVHYPETGRISVLISAASRPALDTAIAAFTSELAVRPVTGSPRGVAAFNTRFGYPIEPGQSVSLRDIGISSTRFDGRLLQQDLSIRLPEDYFVGDYGKATLSLNIDAVTNLTNANRLQVFANGAALASAELTRSGISSRNPLNIPLGGFSPGHNDLRIEVSSLTEADETCDVFSGTAGDRLVLDATNSTIEFDRLARMRVTPTVTAEHLLPKSATEIRPTYIQVASEDVSNLEAAAQLAVATAAVTQEVRPVSIVLASTGIGTQPGLIVAPVNRLSGVARQAYLDTLDENRSAGARSHVGKALGLNAIPSNENGVLASVQRAAGAAWRNMGFKLSADLAPNQRFKLQSNDVLIAQRTSALTSQESWLAFLGLPVKQDTWTVVTGLTSEDIKSGVNTLLREGRLSWLSGDTSLYRADGNQVVSGRLAEPTYFATLGNPSEFTNSRLVVAGVVSHNMLDFVALLLAFCLFLGLTYFVALKRSGR